MKLSDLYILKEGSAENFKSLAYKKISMWCKKNNQQFLPQEIEFLAEFCSDAADYIETENENYIDKEILDRYKSKIFEKNIRPGWPKEWNLFSVIVDIFLEYRQKDFCENEKEIIIADLKDSLASIVLDKNNQHDQDKDITVFQHKGFKNL